MSCEHTPEVSALLDEELGAGEALVVLDHLLRCAECAAFYRRARNLDAALLEAAAGGAEPAAPRLVWERIAAAAGGDEAPASPVASSRRVRLPGWALRLAAAVVLFAGGGVLAWQLGVGRPAPTSGMAGDGVGSSVLTVANTGRMDEQRFVAIATELLAADPWYRDAMCEVLEVAGEGLPREGSTAESGWREEDLRESRGERSGIRRAANRTASRSVAR